MAYPILNRDLLQGSTVFPNDLKIPSLENNSPERVIQFGEGNFLRSFVDWMFQKINDEGLFGGKVVIVQPLAKGMVDLLNQQDGLYTLFLRGYEGDEIVNRKEIISCISRGINPYEKWQEILNLAKKPSIEFIVSNTTEAGIVYDPKDSAAFIPPNSFPGKLAVFLYHRYRNFSGDKSKGMVIIPCELIDRNGDNLKQIVLKLAEDWGLEQDFVQWLKEANTFVNTLVDRVVPGYPKDEISELTNKLGYTDKLISTAECFHLWVIEGPQELSQQLPFAEAELNVIWTEDLTPYRTRKVRILNGAHTSSVPISFLMDLDTVQQMMEHPDTGKFVQEIVYEEIIPSIDLEEGMLREYAGDVIKRFKNPFIKHYLTSILLNSISKYKTRVLPSLLRYIEKRGQIPEKLTLSLASLLILYKENVLSKDGLIFQDEKYVLEFFKGLWFDYDGSRAATVGVAKKALENVSLWGQDLNKVNGLGEKVADHLTAIITHGMRKALTDTLRIKD